MEWGNRRRRRQKKNHVHKFAIHDNLFVLVRMMRSNQAWTCVQWFFLCCYDLIGNGFFITIFELRWWTEYSVKSILKRALILTAANKSFSNPLIIKIIQETARNVLKLIDIQLSSFYWRFVLQPMWTHQNKAKKNPSMIISVYMRS